MTMIKKVNEPEYLSGQFLIAMPGMQDLRFQKTVIYMCLHSEEGAMGMIINRPFNRVALKTLLKQLDIKAEEISSEVNILSGGPVEADRGFVLHTNEYTHESTVKIDSEVSLTATVDVLGELGSGKGPSKCLVVLGYSGWGAGQLDNEIKGNGWLHVDGDVDLLFNGNPNEKWEQAMRRIGVDPLMLSGDLGNA